MHGTTSCGQGEPTKLTVVEVEAERRESEELDDEARQGEAAQGYGAIGNLVTGEAKRMPPIGSRDSGRAGLRGAPAGSGSPDVLFQRAISADLSGWFSSGGFGPVNDHPASTHSLHTASVIHPIGHHGVPLCCFQVTETERRAPCPWLRPAGGSLRNTPCRRRPVNEAAFPIDSSLCSATPYPPRHGASPAHSPTSPRR
ncbi:hypothetical protein RJ55_01137 [Drechmeria coniospora]|nr:hypothetical protein RJ55_01137 [Drechmeria coniospora]